MPMFRKSKFYDGLVPEQFSFIMGINETSEEKTLIKPHTRYIMASTDASDGVSFRKLGLSTDGLGYGRLPYDGTGIFSGFARGLGIFQINGSAINFLTYFTQIAPTTAPFITNSQSSLDFWAFSQKTVSMGLGVFSGTRTPVGIQLPCKVYENNINAFTDFNQFQGLWNLPLSFTYPYPANLIQQGAAPTYSSVAAGNLSGYYAWCYTMVDINGNESNPSPMLAPNTNYASQQITFAIAPGANVNQAVWQTIRIYRTLSSTAQISASLNPTFYYVNGLDVNVTGASSYNVTDNTPDSTVQLAQFGLENVGYVNGQLAALDVSAVPKFIVGWNNAVWGGFWNVSGVDDPIGVYYSASSDNSNLSTGNCASWNNNNYLPIGTLEDGVIIGMWPGLQGRLYVFKEFSTYIIEPTGNALLPYSVTPISNQYGFYHHSIAEIGGSVIGRAKDGIYQFNGSSFKQLTHPLYKTMGRLILPEADSAAYDSSKERYYLAVCDSAITNSYQIDTTYGSGPTTAQSIINCMRNTVIVYDMATGSWETHHNTPIQVFGLLKDSGGREKVFALGMSGDIFCLVDGNSNGSCFSDFFSWKTIFELESSSTISAFPSLHSPQNKIFIPFVFSPDQKITFMENENQISSIVRSVTSKVDISVVNPLPVDDQSALAVTAVAIVPNTVDVVSSVAGGNITLTNNIYNSAGINNYSLLNLTTKNYCIFDPANGLSVNASQVLAPISGMFSLPSVGDSVLVVPYRYMVPIAGSSIRISIPVNSFTTPPFGARLNDTANKFWQMLRLQIKGSGTLYLYGFKNGNETYKEGPYLCTPDETHSFVINSNPTTNTTDANGNVIPNSYQQMIHLAGIMAYYMRVMIWMPRGSGWFEIQDFTSYCRAQEELANL